MPKKRGNTGQYWSVIDQIVENNLTENRYVLILAAAAQYVLALTFGTVRLHIRTKKMLLHAVPDRVHDGKLA